MGKFVGQKYRYGQLVVEVSRVSDVSETIRKFQCTVRGYGHNNPTPRKTYFIDAETNAKASRIALEKYKQEPR